MTRQVRQKGMRERERGREKTRISIGQIVQFGFPETLPGSQIPGGEAAAMRWGSWGTAGGRPD